MTRTSRTSPAPRFRCTRLMVLTALGRERDRGGQAQDGPGKTTGPGRTRPLYATEQRQSEPVSVNGHGRTAGWACPLERSRRVAGRIRLGCGAVRQSGRPRAQAGQYRSATCQSVRLGRRPTIGWLAIGGAVQGRAETICGQWVKPEIAISPAGITTRENSTHRGFANKQVIAFVLFDQPAGGSLPRGGPRRAARALRSPEPEESQRTEKASRLWRHTAI